MFSTININCTHMCNASCIYCYRKYQKADGKCLHSPWDGLNQIESSNISNIVLTGGEPTLSDSFNDIVSLFRGKNITVLTNGILPLQNYRKVNKVVVSLDGDEAVMKVNRRMTKEEYSCIIENVRGYIDSGCNVGISMVITKNNVELFDAFIIENAWLSHCDISIIPVSSGENASSIYLAQADMGDIYRGIDRILIHYNYHIRLSCTMTTKADFMDMFSRKHPKHFMPEYDFVTGRFSYFQYCFDSLDELEKNHCDISEEIQTRIFNFLQSKEDGYLFDPYALAEILMRK